MKRSKIVRHFWLILLLVVFVLTRDVHAYLDPGTGSMVFQAVAAALAAAAYALRAYWGKIRVLFRRRDAASPVETPNERV